MANEKTTQILEEIKTLTILELADLVKALEEEFGVSAAPVAVAGGAAPAAAAAEEKTEFDVILTGAAQTSSLLSRSFVNSPVLALMDAKDLVESSSEADQGRRFQGRRRSNQDQAHRGWRYCRTQVILSLIKKIMPSGMVFFFTIFRIGRLSVRVPRRSRLCPCVRVSRFPPVRVSCIR